MGHGELVERNMAACMSVERYMELRTRASVLSDRGDYKLGAAEMNPVIFEKLIDEMRLVGLPLVVWEPFAGTSYSESSPVSKVQNFAEANGVKLMSYGLVPRDSRIQIKDSMKEGPCSLIGGMLFHPPYPGAMPLSNHSEDLSREGVWMENDWSVKYQKALRRVIRLAGDVMVSDGLTCAIGRDYRLDGERIRLDLIYVELFEANGFVLEAVWNSVPDIVLLFRLKN